MNMFLNPFVTNKPVPPTHFVGRETLVQRCYNRMVGPVRGGIALYGEEGMGRTSLLYYLEDFIRRQQAQALDQPDVLVYLYCPALVEFSPERFFYAVLEKISETETGSDLLDEVDAILEKGKVNDRIFRRFLRKLKQRNRSLTLFLDGFAWITSHITKQEKMVGDFLSHLRALTNDPIISLVLVVSTREPLDDLCGDIVRKRPESFFYNNFMFLRLSPFTDEELEMFLAQSSPNTKMAFDQPDRDLLDDIAGRHPALLQIAAFYLFEEKRQGTLTDERRKNVIKAFENEAFRRFLEFWELSSALEKALLVFLILVNLPEAMDNRPEINQEDITRIYKTYEKEFDNLIERGLVRSKNQTYYIFSILFINWIAHEVDSKEETTLLQEQSVAEKNLLSGIWRLFSDIARELTLNPLNQQLFIRESPPPSLLVPARYQQPEKLGSGGFGTVYKAFDTQLQRLVAIKALHHDPSIPIVDTQQRLLKEAQAASKLQHAHIVTVFNVEEANNQVFLVMEYVEGMTLAERLKMDEVISFEQIIHWGKQAAVALDYAHSQGVIHRDVKPANLLITADDDLKLTDFGIAKLMDDPKTSIHIKGTTLYMSPEQVDQRSLDGRSDLFSLAAVIFELICGASPWPSNTVRDLMNDITTKSPRSVADYEMPHAGVLDAIFQKAFEKLPDKRYDTCAKFMQAFHEASENLDIKPKPNTIFTSDRLSKLPRETLCCLCYDSDFLQSIYCHLDSTTTDVQMIDQIMETTQSGLHTAKLLELIEAFEAVSL